MGQGLHTNITAIAAQELGEDLEPVADSQHGDPEPEDRLVRQRRLWRIHAGRPAGQDDAAGFQRGDCLRGSVVAHNHRIHIALADAPRDDLSVL